MSEKTGNRTFSLQWHVTALCDQNCKHCYATDPRTHQKELKHPLSTEECRLVIEDLVTFCRQIRAVGDIAFTGGDALLRTDFFEILEYARSKGLIVSVLGNPYHLDEAVLKRLRSLEIRGYQISIDGMKELHDYFRKPGSFDASIKALRDLKRYGIRTVVMFSISKVNARDLIPVMKLISDFDVDAFAFARVCGFGNGKEITSDDFTPEEYRQVLVGAYEEEKRLKSAGSKTWFNKKDHLWTLLLSELGEEKFEPTRDGIIYGGCSIGVRSLAILADGAVFACRRFFSPIGKVPEQSIKELFLSTKLDVYRDAEFEKCSKCDLFQYCRGCPAVALGKTGIFGSPDPQCWKKID